MGRDIHKGPFDEATKAKLAIFKDYLKEWLPVFLAKKEVYWNTINIFDFFAGPGSDTNGTKGTPLLIVEELSPYLENIVKKKLKVNLYFNEFKKEKYESLKTKLGTDGGLPCTIKIDNLDFKQAFDNEFPKMGNKDCANLLFLDQSGIKHINEDVFSQIINLKRTDFLFFISSSTIKRFVEHPSIAQYIKLDIEEIEKTPYHQIHRRVLDFYKSLIPKNKEYYLASFSLKKPSGVYGLIFGSNHVLGIEKFLTTCWSIDPERGEANFDIDDDSIIPGQVELFTGTIKRPKKVDQFEKELKRKIMERQLRTDKEIYIFTLTNSFIPSHARKVIMELIREKKIHKSELDLTSKVCKANSLVSQIKFL